MVCYLDDEVCITNLHACMPRKIWQKYNYMLNISKYSLNQLNELTNRKAKKVIHWPSVTFILILWNLYLDSVFAIYERDIVTILLQSTLVLFLSEADVYYQKAGNSLDDDDGNGKSYL